MSAGDKINIGEVFAASGTSGYSTGPHLHFVVWYNNNGVVNSVPLRFRVDGGTLKPKRGLF